MKIFVTKDTIGTGFFCRIRFPDENRRLPVLITKNHILGEKELEIGNIIKITLYDDKIEKNIMIDKSRLIFTNPDLDVTFIQIKPEDKINKFLEIDENIFNDDYRTVIMKGTPIYLLQYPQGIIASHAIGKIEKAQKIRIFHSCSTEPGSSGSPILLLSNFKVIAVHRASKKQNGESFNLGTCIKFPIEEFNQDIKNDNIVNINNYFDCNSNNSFINVNNPRNNLNNTNSEKKVKVVVCFSCLSKNLCCMCLYPKSNISKLGQHFYAHKKCFPKYKCFFCRQFAICPYLRICKNCKEKYILKEKRCFFCGWRFN